MPIQRAGRRRRSPHPGLLVVVTAILCGCGASVSDRPSEASQASGEQLIASPPEGWMLAGAVNQSNLRIADYTDPQTLTAERVDSVRMESQSADPMPDPIDFLLGLREELRRNCTGFRDFPIFSGYENGYPTSVRLLFCRAQGEPKRGLVRMIKAIRGQDYFYIVSRSRTTAPFEPDAEPLSVQDMAAWSTWIGGVTVCDTRSPEHPCPVAVAQPPSGG